MAKNEFGDEIEVQTNEFGDPIEGTVSVIDPPLAKEPLPPEEAFDRAGKVWDAALDEEVPFNVAQEWFFDPFITASDPDDFAAAVPDNRTGFSENFKREWTGDKAFTKIPIAGGIVGLALNAETIQAANRLLDSQFDYDAMNRRAREVHAVGMVFGGGPFFPKTLDIDRKRIAQAIKDFEFEQQGVTFGGRVARGISQLPTWMIEFAATGGLATLGDDVAQKAGEKLLRKYAKTLAGKAAIKTSKLAVGAVIRTSTGLLPRVGEKATARQALIAIGVAGEENWATSLAKAWGEVAIESFTEQTGGAISRGLTAGLAKLPFGGKFMRVLQEQWSALTGGTAENFATRMLTRGGYSTIVGEVGEERLATLLREATGVSDRRGNPFQRIWNGMQEDFKPENLGAEIVTLLAPASVRRGMTMGTSLTPGVSVPTVAVQLDQATGAGPIQFDSTLEAEGYANKAKEVADTEGKDVTVTVDKFDNTVTVEKAVEEAIPAEAGKPPILKEGKVPAGADEIVFREAEKSAQTGEVSDEFVFHTTSADVEAIFEEGLVAGGLSGAIETGQGLGDNVVVFRRSDLPEGFTAFGDIAFQRPKKPLKPIAAFSMKELGVTEREFGFRAEELGDQPEPPELKQGTKAEVPKQPIKPTETVTQPQKDILGVEPVDRVLQSLQEAKRVQPRTKAEQKAERRKRVGAAAGALKSNVKKGSPVEESIFRSSGLLKGPLTEYEQVFTSIEDTMNAEDKDALYAKVYNHPGLRYFDVLNTATSLKKLLAGTALTDGDVANIEQVFGKTGLAKIAKLRVEVSGLFDKAINLWKAGLLTGIKTSGLNTLSNMTHFMTETAKDIPGALVDNAVSLYTGERALAFTTKGSVEGMKKGVRLGWVYLRTGYSERDIGKKLDFTKVNFGNSKFAKGLQMYEETIFHLLGAEDQPFYYGAKARSLFSQAIAQAKNKKLTGTNRDAFVERLIQSPTDDMLEAAVHDAEVAVFQNRTGFGDIARSVQKTKIGQIIVPFGRTPSAIATQIINYSPIGPAKEVADQIAKGEFNQRKFSQAFGRGIVGTGVLAVGGLLFKAGLMTLDRPKTERERKLWELEGRKANSIKIGDKWRSVQVLGPAGNVLIIGGHFQQGLIDTGSPTKAIVQAMTGGAKSFSEQTFVTGVNQAVSALVDPDRSFEGWFSSMAGSVVPTIVADIARAQDDKARRTEGPFQRVQSRIPVLREKLPPRIDVFGQDLPRYGGNPLEVMIDPTRPSLINNDVVVTELRRLFDNGIKVSPTLLGDKAGFDVLTTEENTQLWRRSGELTYKLLQAWITSDGYGKVSNDFAKGKSIEQLVSKAKAAAKIEMASIKINQGTGIVELAEAGLLTVEGLEALKFFGTQ